MKHTIPNNQNFFLFHPQKPLDTMQKRQKINNLIITFCNSINILRASMIHQLGWKITFTASFAKSQVSIKKTQLI